MHLPSSVDTEMDTMIFFAVRLFGRIHQRRRSGQGNPPHLAVRDTRSLGQCLSACR